MKICLKDKSNEIITHFKIGKLYKNIQSNTKVCIAIGSSQLVVLETGEIFLTTTYKDYVDVTNNYCLTEI